MTTQDKYYIQYSETESKMERRITMATVYLKLGEKTLTSVGDGMNRPHIF